MITDLPRLPLSNFSPPVGENGAETGASTLGLPDCAGAGSKLSLSSISFASTV